MTIVVLSVVKTIQWFNDTIYYRYFKFAKRSGWNAYLDWMRKEFPIASLLMNVLQMIKICQVPAELVAKKLLADGKEKYLFVAVVESLKYPF